MLENWIFFPFLSGHGLKPLWNPAWLSQLTLFPLLRGPTRAQAAGLVAQPLNRFVPSTNMT
jgi:hypothetical protein